MVSSRWAYAIRHIITWGGSGQNWSWLGRITEEKGLERPFSTRIGKGNPKLFGWRRKSDERQDQCPRLVPWSLATYLFRSPIEGDKVQDIGMVRTVDTTIIWVFISRLPPAGSVTLQPAFVPVAPETHFLHV